MARKKSRKIRIKRNKRLRQQTKSKRSVRRTRIKKTILAPRTAKQLSALLPQDRDRWIRVTHVVSEMRSKRLSRSEASRQFGVSPDTVLKLAPSAFKKKNGRYQVRLHDRLPRVIIILTRKGLREIVLLDSHEASLVGQYWSAVERFLTTGDASALQKLPRKTVKDADGKRIRLLTDLTEIRRQASAGILHFESIYGRRA